MPKKHQSSTANFNRPGAWRPHHVP